MTAAHFNRSKFRGYGCDVCDSDGVGCADRRCHHSYGYRDWRLISVAREEAPLSDIRAVLGNDIAISAYREATRPFPDGTIIARLAWSLDPSEENNKAFGRFQSFVAGAPKNGVQFMIKDAKKYAATGGWGYAHFNEDGQLADEKVHSTCHACHQSASARDFVFTDYSR